MATSIVLSGHQKCRQVNMMSRSRASGHQNLFSLVPRSYMQQRENCRPTPQRTGYLELRETPFSICHL